MKPQAHVYLCHLAHGSTVLNVELVPYAIGRLKSHYLAHARNPAPVELFVRPQPLAAACARERPGLVGFSNFLWNRDLGYRMAEAIKQRWPDTAIVFGGPDFPLEREGFLALPVSRRPTRLRFTYLPWQRELLGDQLRRYGPTLSGWCKILSRTPIKKMHRRALRLDAAPA